MSGIGNIDDLMNDDSSAIYEHELEREPYNFRIWWQYIQSKRGKSPEERFAIYRRALKNLPGSYKLWNNYLEERRRQCQDVMLDDKLYTEVNQDHDQALLYMHKMPKMWLMYCRFLIKQKKITVTRRTFDRALQSLPITQHDMIWDLYIDFVRNCGVWETAVKVFRRYMLIEPSVVEQYIDYLIAIEKYDEAALELCKIINRDNYKSKNGTTKHEFWEKLMNLMVKHPTKVTSLNISRVIRSGIMKFPEEEGRWWCMLAEYYNRINSNEKARDVYEEAIQVVSSVRDFTMVFDAYVQSEMYMLEIILQNEEEEEEENAMSDEDDLNFGGELVTEEILDLTDLADLSEDFNDLDLRRERLAHLIGSQPILLNNVRLRQNPHDVHQWQYRVNLFLDPSKGAVTEPDPAKAVIAYTEAVKTIDPLKAVGKLSLLWIAFAKFYEQYDDLENATRVFEKAIKVPFKSVEELATVWAEWIEMYLRHDLLEEAYQTCLRATTPYRGEVDGQEDFRVQHAPQERVYRALRLWSLLVDLEESIGTMETTKAAYDRMFDLKIITPQNVLNYTAYLEEHSCYEEAFRIYERGVSVFKFPHSREIWLQYINRFIQRYQGTKLERAREIFERCIQDVTADYAKEFYLLYSRLEEEYGMMRHAMDILDRATTAVPPQDKHEVFLYYIKKVEEYYGATKTREVYEKAMETVPEDRVKDIALRFADLETKLGEIDRARAIFTYASQFCNPQTQITFWALWKDFEARHGNKETFKEMKRIERSVQAEFAQREIISGDATEMSMTIAEEGHATISGFKRGGVEGGQKSAIGEMESKVQRVMEKTGGLEDKEMAELKRAVERDPSVLEKEGKDPSVFIKNLNGVSSESVFNKEE